MKAETPAETPAVKVAEVCRAKICFWEGYTSPRNTSDFIVILDVQNLQAPEAPAATPEAGSCFLGSLQLSKS